MNKMQKKETAKEEIVEIIGSTETDYLFPNHDLVIRAKSLAEAEEKLQAILQKQNKPE